ncbi:MAG: ankyrin repeat domain-containing protein, partial [Alphaproteobacteria bacterium]|nr:ankyrin repeat domain-containing protein [Alphaproteobacteria bacterium]
MTRADAPRADASQGAGARARPRAALAALLVVTLLALAAGAFAQILGETGRSSAEANDRLFEAVFNNDLDSVKLSIAQGAKLEARNKLGRNALELAIDLGHFEVAHYLLALRHHRRAQVARNEPPKPAPPPPFVPAEPPPAEVPLSPPPPPEVAAATPAPAPPTEPAPKPVVVPAQVAATTAAVAAPVAAPLAAPAATAPPAAASEASPTPGPKPRPEIALAAAPSPTPRVEALAAGAPLGVSLKLGLGATAATAAGDEPCVDKRKGAVRICILPVEWPAEIERHFLVDSFLYRGAKALARFENGEAIRLYAQFPVASFEAVADLHRRRLGPPQEIGERQTRLAGGGKAVNRVLVWKLRAAAGKRVSVVEIRSLDDVRRRTAAPGYGAIQA